MLFLKPFKNCSVENITQFYHQKHKAIDWLPIRKGLLAYGTPLVAPEDCTIGKIYGDSYDKNNPHDDAPIKNGYGLFMRGASGYEHMYWHTQPIMPVSTGDFVKKGTIVAYCGNSGNVFSGGKYVPIEERNIPNYAGTHLHQTIYKFGVGELLNPLDTMDMYTEPTYGIIDELKSMSIVLAKISKLIS